MARQPNVDSARLHEALKHNPKVINALDSIGAQIAVDAAAAAPKNTGAGARSIRHEVDYDSEGPHVRVSWDRDHFYMMFAELGTSHENARPFLRPAAEKPRSV